MNKIFSNNRIINKNLIIYFIKYKNNKNLGNIKTINHFNIFKN